MIKVGDTVSFIHNGHLVRDRVRRIFVKEIFLEPYARNKKKQAVVLTKYSWIYVDEIIGG